VQQKASPAVIVIAVVVLVVVVFFVYRFTIGKPAKAPEGAVPGPGGYGAGMQSGQMPGGGGPSPVTPPGPAGVPPSGPGGGG